MGNIVLRMGTMARFFALRGLTASPADLGREGRLTTAMPGRIAEEG